MLKKLITILLLCGISTLLLTACGNNDTSTTGNKVHMDNSTFVQSSITIKKGESVTLVADTLTPHIISSGTWESGAAKPASEPGTPPVKDMQIGGYGSGTIGPFNTAGTFKFYCTVHSGMNLTIVVQ